MSEKNYIGGSAKARQTQYGEILSLSLKLEDMQKIVNDRGYVNMTVLRRREPGQYGDTHYVVEDDYMKNRDMSAPDTSSEPAIEAPF